MPARALFGALLACAALAAIGCDGGKKGPSPTSASRPIPSPVAYAPDPEGEYRLGDPTIYGYVTAAHGEYGLRRFEPLAGATVDAGRLGGSIYEMEVPDHWNGRLVLYLHRQHDPAEMNLTIDTFWLRSYLIRNGYAWGASSGSSNLSPQDRFADETAALWDLFVQRHGRPQYSYIVGEERGSVAARIAATRYADRFDGALAICSDDYSIAGDPFVAAAYVAGVTQAEFDTTAVSDLITTRILPSLDDPATLRRFQDIVIDLSGGPRPFAREGLTIFRSGVLLYPSEFLINAGLYDNHDVAYHLSAAAGVADEDFNRAAVRRTFGNPDLERRLRSGEADSYRVAIPVLTINTTGNPNAPISIDQKLRRNVDAAGAGDLLVQRTVRSPADCDLWGGEWERGLEDLVAWVERGDKAAGEDLLASDLSEIGADFTAPPRVGSPEGDVVPGADQRITLSGAITVDGEPLLYPRRGVISTYVNVNNDGILGYCDFVYAAPKSGLPPAIGHYELTLAADAEVHGCGKAGSVIFLFLSDGDRKLIAEKSIVWPKSTRDLTFDATFSSAAPFGAAKPHIPGSIQIEESVTPNFFGSYFEGVPLDASGKKMPPGTLIEAYITNHLCGVYQLPAITLSTNGLLGESSTYGLPVSSPDLKPGCARGEKVTFRVNGVQVAATGVNDFGEHEIDLRLP